MTTRHESGKKKLQNRMMQELRSWASDFVVKHKGMDEYELEDSFKKDGYSLYIERDGSEINISLYRDSDNKKLRKGRVYLESDYHKEDVFYEDK